jgi:hypothetical protein
MALGQIHRGVRELIRVTMRERGIKHRSHKNEIRSITYAQQPTMTIEYEGPIFITYEEPVVKVVCYGGDKDLAYEDPHVRRKIKHLSWVHHSELPKYRRKEHIVDSIGIDIHDPKFCDILGKFLDKHISKQNKNQDNWKRLYRDTDEEFYFIPTTVQLKQDKYLTVRQAIIRWVMLKFFNIDPSDYDWYWRETVKRHFRCTAEDLEQVNQTVTALRNSKLSHEEIEHNTVQIMNGHVTEY